MVSAINLPLNFILVKRSVFCVLRFSEMSFRTFKLKITGAEIACFSIVDYKFSSRVDTFMPPDIANMKVIRKLRRRGVL